MAYGDYVKPVATSQHASLALTQMECPICQSESRHVFQKHGYWIRECLACGHQFCELTPTAEHPNAIYADSYFSEGGAGYSDYLSEADLLIAHGKRYGKLLQRYTSPGRVLDIGSAAGFILKGLEAYSWSGVGLEPNATMAQYAQQSLGLDVRVSALETFRADEKFNLVTMIQVVAHFYELRQAFETAANLTQPGGYWLIETWNKDSLLARAFGQNWHEYSPPSVLHWFSSKSLDRLITPFGFRRIAQGRPAKWLNGAHAKSLLDYKLKDSPSGLKLLHLIPDGMLIPYPTFDLFWILYQKEA
jgi:SAM-dependent methyltransferase